MIGNIHVSFYGDLIPYLMNNYSDAPRFTVNNIVRAISIIHSKPFIFIDKGPLTSKHIP